MLGEAARAKHGRIVERRIQETRGPPVFILICLVLAWLALVIGALALVLRR